MFGREAMGAFSMISWNDLMPQESSPRMRVAVWMVLGPSQDLSQLTRIVSRLARPEFVLEECVELSFYEESGVFALDDSIYWRCHFRALSSSTDPYVEIRLVKRLIGLGAEVFRYERESSYWIPTGQPVPRHRALGTSASVS